MFFPARPAHNVRRRQVLKAIAGGVIATAAVSFPRPLAAFSGSQLPPALAHAGADWQLTFEDNFDDPAEFRQTWEALKKGGRKLLTMRYPKNVVVENGALDLRLGHQRNPKRPFTGGYVRTRSFRQRYGYFECDMRIASEPGVNNAFWMTSDKASEGDTHFELDVAEAKYPNIVQVSARRWKPEKIIHAADYRADVRLDESFHRYAMLWTEDIFRFYVDDLEVFEVENTFAFTPALLLFSNAVAPFAGKNDGDVLGAATTIRRVRAFQSVGT